MSGRAPKKPLRLRILAMWLDAADEAKCKYFKPGRDLYFKTKGLIRHDRIVGGRQFLF